MKPAGVFHDLVMICCKFSLIIALRCCGDDHNDKQTVVVGLVAGDDQRYLWQSAVELSLQRVSLVADLVQLALRHTQVLLRLSERVQQSVSLLQHRHHQRLKVALRVRLHGRAGAQSASVTADLRLADGGHHLAHHLHTDRRALPHRRNKSLISSLFQSVSDRRSDQ